MASNTRIPKAELTGIYGAMVTRMSRKLMGDVPEPVEVTWRNRKVLNFSFAISRKAKKWDQCDPNLSVSIAMLTVLETLAPAERAVFVLREVFDLPYAEIAAAVDKTPAAVRNPYKLARVHEEAMLSR